MLIPQPTNSPLCPLTVRASLYVDAALEPVRRGAFTMKILKAREHHSSISSCLTSRKGGKNRFC